MKVRCLRGCFEREVPKHLEEEIRKDERFLVCAKCFERALIVEEPEKKS